MIPIGIFHREQILAQDVRIIVGKLCHLAAPERGKSLDELVLVAIRRTRPQSSQLFGRIPLDRRVCEVT